MLHANHSISTVPGVSLNANARRTPHSGRTSATHSASQSRSASVQSSPKVPRGRRLPPEETMPKTPENPSNDQLTHPQIITTSAPNPLLHHPQPHQQQAPSIPPQGSQQTYVHSTQYHSQVALQSHIPHPAHAQSPPTFHPSAPIFYPQSQNATGSGTSTPPQLPLLSTYSPHAGLPGPYSGYSGYSPYGGEYPSAGPSLGPGYVPWGAHGHVSGHQSPVYPPPHLHGQVYGHVVPGQYLPPMSANGLHVPVPQHQQTVMGGSSATVPPTISVPVATEESPVPSSPISNSGVRVPQLASTSSGGGPKMVFGSIGAPGGSALPSPGLSPAPIMSSGRRNETGRHENGAVEHASPGEDSKTFVQSIAIGVDAAEAVPARLKSRTRDGKDKDVGKEGDVENEPSTSSPVTGADRAGLPHGFQKEVMKWKFGTASSTPPPPSGAGVNGSGVPLPPSSLGSQEFVPHHQLPPSVTMPNMHVGANVELSSQGTDGFAMDPRGSVSFVMPPRLSVSGAGSASGSATGSPLMPQHIPGHVSASGSGAASPLGSVISSSSNQNAATLPASVDPDLEVKDYGFGFGDASGSGYMPIQAKERQKEWEREREMRWHQQQQDVTIVTTGMEGAPEPGKEGEPSSPVVRDQLPAHGGRGRRGGGLGGLNSIGRGGYANGNGVDRGGFGGGGRRGRGLNGYPRGYGGRGGGGYNVNRGGAPVPQQRPPPFVVTPPPHFQALPMDGSSGMASPGGYYPGPPPPPHARQQYMTSGYEPYPPQHALPPPMSPHAPGLMGQHPGPPNIPPHPPHLNPPVPVPLSTISFPLDPTRYYLLGQLEYYLSPQNMAQDFFLRQQVRLVHMPRGC